LIGDYAARIYGRAKVTILEGEPGNLAAASRQKGILEGLKARPDIKVIANLTSYWRRDKAMAITEDWLQAYPQIDGFFVITMTPRSAPSRLSRQPVRLAKSWFWG
jgi:ABC-type sugar transport system substrate-binding protein